KNRILRALQPIRERLSKRPARFLQTFDQSESRQIPMESLESRQLLVAGTTANDTFQITLTSSTQATVFVNSVSQGTLNLSGLQIDGNGGSDSVIVTGLSSVAMNYLPSSSSPTAASLQIGTATIPLNSSITSVKSSSFQQLSFITPKNVDAITIGTA